MTATAQQAIDALSELRLKVRCPPEFEPKQQTAQLLAYADDLAEYHVEDVRLACKAIARNQRWWPSLAEVLDACEAERTLREARAKAKRLPPPDGADPWSLPWQQLGVGLSIVRGQCLLDAGTGDADTARRRFNGIVARRGLPGAARLADAAYRPGGDHKAMLQVLEENAA